MKYFLILAMATLGPSPRAATTSSPPSTHAIRELSRRPIPADLVVRQVQSDLTTLRAKYNAFKPSLDTNATWESGDVITLINNLLPNRGKKVVAISKVALDSALPTFCSETRLLDSPNYFRTGWGIECKINAAQAAIFMSFSGELIYWAKLDHGARPDLETILASLEKIRPSFRLTTVEINEELLPPATES